MPPPEGVIPDFYRQTDLQHTLIVVYCVTFGLASVALAMRLYTRAFLVKNAGLDERESCAPSLTPWPLKAPDRKGINTIIAIIFLSWAVSLAFFITSVKGTPT